MMIRSQLGKDSRQVTNLRQRNTIDQAASSRENLTKSLEETLAQKGLDTRFSSKSSMKQLEIDKVNQTVFDKRKPNVPLLMLDLEPGRLNESNLTKKKSNGKVIVSGSNCILMKKKKVQESSSGSIS